MDEAILASRIQQLEKQRDQVRRDRATVAAHLKERRQESESARQRWETLQQEASALIGRINGVKQATSHDVVERLNAQIGEYENELNLAYPPAWASWSQPSWDTWKANPVERPLRQVRIGSKPEIETYQNEHGLPDLPVQTPLLDAAGPWLVKCDGKTTDTALAFMRSIILRTALAMQDNVQFTLLDPIQLGAAFPMRNQLPYVRPQRQTSTDELMEVQEDIQRINRDVVGHHDGMVELPPERRAGERFEIVVLVDFPESLQRDPRSLDALVRIANSGPRAGRHLILMVRDDQDFPRDFSLDHFKNATIIDCRTTHATLDTPPPAERQQELLKTITAVQKASSAGDWNTIVRPETLFGESARDLIETPVGDRLRFWFGEERDGRPCAHGTLAGQTGSGKSSLLHVIITGLAARYSPDELRMVFIDGKQGVEFRAYENLPHAEVICLQTRPEMARRALADLVRGEMSERFKRFQEVGAQKLADYRTRSGETMPRVLLIVDEFQQLLDGDEAEGAALLQEYLYRGRAAGLHALLASQRFDVQGLPESAMSEVHLSAALSLKPSYVQGLQAFAAEGRKMIQELPKSGHVVINDESGRDGANVRGAVARLSGDTARQQIETLVDEIIAARGEKGRPIVVSGAEGVTLRDNQWIMQWRETPPDPATLQRTARTPLRQGGFGFQTWSSAEKPVPLWLGANFDIRGHMPVVLRRAPNENLLALGIGTQVRRAMLASALTGLKAMLPPEQIAVTVIDGLPEGLPGSGYFDAALDVLRADGYRCERLDVEQTGDILATLARRARARADPDARSHLLVLAEPEYIVDLHVEGAASAVKPGGPAGDLRDVLSKGPQRGLHTVFTATGLGAVGAVLHPSRETRIFNHRAMQQMSAEDSMTLLSNLHANRVDQRTQHPTGALYVNIMQDNTGGTLFKAYGVSQDVDAEIDADTLTSVLGVLKEAVPT